ncbi:MAG TPA: sugar kinase, partial [Propionibacteriaceae bacterium]
MPSSLNSAGELLQLFRTGTVATRGELQRVTGLARSTLTARIDALLAAGYLTEDGSVVDLRRGRPSTRLRVNDQATTVLVADLGRTHGRLAVSTAAGDVISETV